MVDNSSGPVCVHSDLRSVQIHLDWVQSPGIFRSVGVLETVGGLRRYALFRDLVFSDTGFDRRTS